MERIGVIRDNGVVINIIVWADHTPEQLARDGFTEYEEVTDLGVRPGVGWTWDSTNGYRPPSPFQSWTWDGVAWVAPKPEPSEGGPYQWNETTKKWEAIPQEEPQP